MVAKSKKSSSKVKKPSKKVKTSVSKPKLGRASGSSQPEVKSMEALLKKYGSGSSGLERGQKVKGKIKEITPNKVTVDIGGKADGIVAESAFNEAKDYIKTLEVGDEVSANVIISEMPDGSTILSFRHAAANASWEKIENSKKKGTAIVVFGKSSRSSGVMVDLDGLMGFIPTSQLGIESSKNPNTLVNQHFKAIVIDSNRDTNKVVLSEREVTDAEGIKRQKEAMKKIKEGEVYSGKVTTLADFGCFVEIKIAAKKGSKVAVEGLVHISELSWDKVRRPSNVVSEEDKVKVKVIGTDKGRLAFSMKQAGDDPWEKAAKKYKKDAKVKGEIVKSSDFGVFVKLEPGVEGLIHMTKIPPGKRLNVGDSVNVYVEEVDPKARKISLGLVLTAKPVGYR